eukprot:TRINITY_DN750_c0_g1_i1.p1 TRINITY_DN750_c0_g1~~TRINITY_DN750_c0_g1_i1.p1  ORF type:complete len:250 (+),score=48.73 TRINITY_DN750_c0_g1_i1:64-813(+)
MSTSSDSEVEKIDDSYVSDENESVAVTLRESENGLNKRVGIEFRDIRFSVKTKEGSPCKREEKTREILKGLTGTIEGGDFVAIMGASGAGKTTFLDILSGRIKPSSGKVIVDGKATSPGHTYPKQAYVRQQDFLMANFTPKELLQFSADLRIPNSVSNAEKKERVKNTLTQLRLEKCQNTKVGGRNMRGISGGEAKRLSVGIELITDPSVLYLDEPTSGLDTTTAYTTVETLRKLSESGRTVVLSLIHI